MIRCNAMAVAARRTLLVALVGFLMVTASVYGAAGNLDPSFGNGGKVTTDFGGGDAAFAMALQSDGKIVAAGFPTLARYNTNGTLDTSFGSGGKVTDFRASAVALQPDGKIVVGGGLLGRYNTNGTLDTSFGSGGHVSIDFDANGVGIQSDGKIVAGGRAGPAGHEHFALARFNADGTVDTSFGTYGEVTTAIGRDAAAFALAIQSDGKILLVGTADTPTTSNDFALARYNTNGTLDATFGTGGTVTTDFVSASGDPGLDVAFAVKLQLDGKIVVAGYNENDDNSNFAFFLDFGLARYNPNGTLDTTFGTGGKVNTDFSGSPSGNDKDDWAYAVEIQLDGKIVAAGFAHSSSTADDFALARYNTNGTLDTSFGTAGRVRTDFSGSADSAQAVAIQLDGKIVAAGFATVSSGNRDFALARYEGLTSQDLIAALGDQVQGLANAGALNQGQSNSLTVKLTNVLNSLSQVKTKTACNQLNAFINEVNAHISSGVLTAPEGQALLDIATAIRQMLGC